MQGNKIIIHRSNSPFGNTSTLANASVAKRAIYADAQYRNNWTVKRLIDK